MQAYQSQQVPYAAPSSSPRAPYAAPGPKQQASTGSGLAVKILKAVSLFLGLIGMSVALHGYFNADWFHVTQPGIKCEPRKPCVIVNHNPDAKCEEDINMLLRNATDKSLSNYELACPSRWLVIPQVFIIAFVWVGTLVGLILLTAAGASQNKTLPLLDMIGHVVAGILTIVSALCLLGFSLDVIVKDNCDRIFKIASNPEGYHIIRPTLQVPNLPPGGGGGPYNPGGGGGPYNPGGGGGPYNPGGGGGPYNPGGGGDPYYPGGDGLYRYGRGIREEFLKEVEKAFKITCNNEQRKIYFQWHILFGGIFAFLTGILYIGIGLFALIGRRKGGQPKPQMMGQGSMTPSQTQMQQQQPSAYYASVPQQTPSTPAPAAQSPSQAPEN